MSAPARPKPVSGVRSTSIIAKVALKRSWRGKAAIIAAVLLAFGPALAIIVATSKRNPELQIDSLLSTYLKFLVPCVIAIFTSRSIAEEVKERTITYLVTHPIKRWSIVMGKYFATLAICLPLAVLSMVITLGILTIPTGSLGSELSHCGIAIASVCVACIYYSSMAAAFGAFAPKGALFMMLIVVIIDGAMSAVPGSFRSISSMVHMLNIAGIYKSPKIAMIQAPDIPRSDSMITLIFFMGMWFVIALSVAARAEYKTQS